MAIVLGATVAVSFTIAHATISAIESGYESIIFGRIIPNIQSMGEAGFAAEEKAIIREATATVEQLLAEAAAMSTSRSQLTFGAEDYRDRIADRRVRGGIDKLGSLFIVADEAKQSVIFYRGQHDMASKFIGVVVESMTIPDPAHAVEQLRARHQERTATFDRRQAELADRRLSFARFKGVIDQTIDQIHQSRDDMAEFKLRNRISGLLAVLATATIGGGMLGWMLLRLARAVIRQGRAIDEIIASAHQPELLAGVIVSDIDRPDQLGTVARGIARAKETFLRVHQLEEERRNAERAAEMDKLLALTTLADHFESTVKARVLEVSKASSSIGRTAHSMASQSEKSGGCSMALGDIANKTTERAAVVSAATRQLASSINGIAHQVRQSTEIAGRAVSQANSTSDQMRDLSRTVHSIEEIVSLINAIAAQTNLLALNATIEAARAGEAGKGFAVVAGEVKNLATQTAKATEEISAQVAAVQDSTLQMTSAIDGVVSTIQAIDTVTATIAGEVQQQEAATRDIAANIDQVAQEANDVVDSVITLAKASTMACAGTVRVIWSSNSLSKVVHSLEGDVNHFMAEIRTSGTRA
ncbi:hypothetical protein A6A04_10350 [Paramagnetospirillum marisnigri]|uniref:Methyl-accepting transducer domain-containing protein n=1 Tax=Paramagnetospirillum marisnigri TaxID=1285242 RepID=A0A178MXH3_9PROT|nr:hypothetical protein A6A04_10350 [Paramagnetospirillum marisnigri]